MLYTNNVFKLKIKEMGLLTKGMYSRGNKTTSQIAALTGMVAGDTVFDTDREERQVYDGNVWISGNQIGVITRGQTPGGLEQITGAASIISDQNFTIQSGISSTNDENIIGCLQGVLGTSYNIGSYVIIQYRGLGYAATAANTVNSGQYMDLSGTRGRAIGAASPSVGTFGIWLETIPPTAAGRAMIQPIEIN
jgi:hypothetical protein